VPEQGWTKQEQFEGGELETGQQSFLFIFKNRREKLKVGYSSERNEEQKKWIEAC
jgi:hypothetical protein